MFIKIRRLCQGNRKQVFIFLLCIFISGFGTFSIVKRKARKGRNRKTGEKIKIAAKFIPKFKPAKEFKEAVK
jgi:nucleoid DNA-binding protein